MKKLYTTILFILLIITLSFSSISFAVADQTPKIEDVIFGETGVYGHVLHVRKDNFYYMCIITVYKDGSFTMIVAPIDKDCNWHATSFEYEDIIYFCITDLPSIFGNDDFYIYDAMKIEI